MLRCGASTRVIASTSTLPESNRSSAWRMDRVEQRMSPAVVGEIADGIPPEWYSDEYDQLGELLVRLDRRRGRVRELIVSARDSVRQPFTNWK